MAGNYAKALRIFGEEEELLQVHFPNRFDRLSANSYEQGYTRLQCGEFEEAQKRMAASVEYAMESKDAMCQGCAYRGMGEVLASLNAPEAAAGYFDRSIDAFRKAGDEIAVAQVEDFKAKQQG